jgi:hypothetical protein
MLPGGWKWSAPVASIKVVCIVQLGWSGTASLYTLAMGGLASADPMIVEQPGPSTNSHYKSLYMQ